MVEWEEKKKRNVSLGGKGEERLCNFHSTRGRQNRASVGRRRRERNQEEREKKVSNCRKGQKTER